MKIYQFVYALMVQLSNYDWAVSTLILAKTVAGVLIVINAVRNYIEIKNNDIKYEPKDLIRTIVLIAFLISYNFISQTFEDLFLQVDIYVNSHLTDNGITAVKETPKLLYSNDLTEDSDLSEQYPLQIMAEILRNLWEYIKRPHGIIIRILEVLAELLSSLVYASALLTRAFMLIFLKLIGPIAIALSTFKKWNNAIYQWINTYVIYVLWLLPIYLSNTFFIFVFNEAHTSPVFSDTDIAVVGTLISLVAAITKFIIIKQSLTWLKTLISIQSV